MNDRILLINPVNHWVFKTPFLGLASLASALEKIGIEVKIIDCQVSSNYKEIIVNLLKSYPNVGISANVASISSALEISKLIKQVSPATKIIMGGPQPTAIYDKLIPEYADIVVMGEGEDTIVELLRSDNLERIRGIAYWENEVKVTTSRPFIADLDRLPFPAWHLVNLEKYRFANTHIPFVGMMTSRGCPYQCIYCTKFVHGTKLRLRSLDNVIREIDYLVNRFGIREIHIQDDNLLFYPERVKELCRMIISRNYKDLRFNLGSGVAANVGDQEMFKLLALAGTYFVSFAIESASQDISHKIGRRIDLKLIRQKIDMAKKAGMRTRALFILGLPFDTVASMEESIRFARNLPVDYASFFIAIPFPGTRFYEIVEKDGKFLYDLITKSDHYTTGKAVYEMDSLKAKDVERMYKRAYRKFYWRPIQIWRYLPRKFDFTNLWGQIKYSYLLFFRFGRM